MNTAEVGTLNGPVIGIVIKEMVRRAMASIARNRMRFVATEKSVDYKVGEDFLTTADTEAQRIYLKTIRESFPTFGVIAEEEGLAIECSEPGTDIYFTVDPLDGTKAFIRRQSHGIGTMISLVRDGEIIAACVGDVMTGEIYYYRPDSPKVHRFSWNDDFHEVLSVRSQTLASQYALLGDDPRVYCGEIEEITRPGRGIFKNIEVSGGSIGVRVARLWKGEVGAVVLRGGHNTPWDWCPIAGISKKLGFCLLECEGGRWSRKPLLPIKRIEHWPNDFMIVHESAADELLSKTVIR